MYANVYFWVLTPLNKGRKFLKTDINFFLLLFWQRVVTSPFTWRFILFFFFTHKSLKGVTTRQRSELRTTRSHVQIKTLPHFFSHILALFGQSYPVPVFRLWWHVPVELVQVCAKAGPDNTIIQKNYYYQVF